jgi:hypothetical protein
VSTKPTHQDFVPLAELMASLPPEQIATPEAAEVERMLDAIDPYRLEQGNDLGTTRALYSLVAQLCAENLELLTALQGVVRVADRKTDEFDAAHRAIAKVSGRHRPGVPERDTLFIVCTPGLFPRIGYPVGELETSLKQWRAGHPSAAIYVLRAGSVPPPGTASIDTAENVLAECEAWRNATDPTDRIQPGA